MKLPIFNLRNQKSGEKTLPNQFSEEYRPDLIRRAVLAVQASRRQPYGAYPEAGQRHSAEVSKRRRKYRGCYGHGISRVTRKVLSRRGTQFNWVGALVPHTRGGRRAHPPKAEKIWQQKINKKENHKAIRSALAATLNRELVGGKGHRLPPTYPFIFDSSAENLAKTKEIKKILEQLNLGEELEHSSIKKVRAGKGKSRGRRYQKKKGLLLVVGGGCNLLKAGRNIPGMDVVKVNQLNAEWLAPGGQAGRITLFTEKAIDRLGGENLFV